MKLLNRIVFLFIAATLFAFPDAPQGCYLNNTYPNSKMDFSRAIADCTILVMGHETGQFQVYPDYRENKKREKYIL